MPVRKSPTYARNGPFDRNGRCSQVLDVEIGAFGANRKEYRRFGGLNPVLTAFQAQSGECQGEDRRQGGFRHFCGGIEELIRR